jgi:hypothetical protein
MVKELDPVGDAVTDLIDKIEGKKPLTEATIAGDRELTSEQRARLPYVMALYHACFLCCADPPPYGMYAWTMEGQTIITPICRDCSQLVGLREIIQPMVVDLVRRHRMH